MSYQALSWARPLSAVVYNGLQWWGRSVDQGR